MNRITNLWYLYDFANSFASIVLVVYYPLILSERGASNNWIGISASIATGVLLLSLPYLGAYSDRTGKRLLFIRVGSALMFISLLALAFLTQRPGDFSLLALFVISFFYIIFQVCFQGSYVFYSAMLRSITSVDKNVKVSGMGLGLGQLGNAIALGIIGVIVGSSLIVIGLSGKSLAMLIGGILFIIIALPFLKQKDLMVSPEKIGFSYKEFFKKIIGRKKIFSFLIGYSFLSDAILTFQLYLTVFIKRIFGLSDQMISYVAIVALLFTVCSAILAGKFARRFKNKEKALRVSGLIYAICFGLCAIIPPQPVFIFLAIAISGAAYGLVFSLSRAVYSEITPVENQGEFFSIYTVFERAASVIGPLLWLFTFFLLKSFGESIQYRGSIIILMFICLGGLYYLKKSSRITI
jgi:UMF1 family MFS transporter